MLCLLPISCVVVFYALCCAGPGLHVVLCCNYLCFLCSVIKCLVTNHSSIVSCWGPGRNWLCCVMSLCYVWLQLIVLCTNTTSVLCWCPVCDDSLVEAQPCQAVCCWAPVAINCAVFCAVLCQQCVMPMSCLWWLTGQGPVCCWAPVAINYLYLTIAAAAQLCGAVQHKYKYKYREIQIYTNRK